MKVVFLDIDGVLNSFRTAICYGGYPFEVDGKDRSMFDEVALGLIRGIVARAGAKVVLSSSWRITHRFEKIGKALDLPIIDRTPSMLGGRGKEIKHWLEAETSPAIECYAIIDDDSDMLPEQTPYFVHTNMHDGFLWSHAERLAELMGISIFDVNHPRLREPAPALAWECPPPLPLCRSPDDRTDRECEAVKTLKLRIKDKHAPVLGAMAREVNTVWNFANETSSRSIRERQKLMTGYDLQKYVAGFSKCDGVLIGSGTADLVCVEYATKRKQFKRARLSWRVSNQKSTKRSLGWVPFKGDNIKYVGGQVRYAGHMFSFWDSFGLGGYDLRAGSFNQDARGRWYLNVTVEAKPTQSSGTAAVGIDLGLKTAVTVSDGQTFEGRLYRASEKKLAMAQRAGKKRLVKTVHAKISNQRKDGLHKFSTALVKQNAAIFVGDVSSAKLVKTTMAKSTHDAGWSMFKRMLEYKSHQAGIVFDEVNESFTTQTCNVCGVIAGPKGRAGLNKRVWQCECGAVHDRDVNAALNIRRRGLATLEAGAEALLTRDRSSQPLAQKEAP